MPPKCGFCNQARGFVAVENDLGTDWTHHLICCIGCGAVVGVLDAGLPAAIQEELDTIKEKLGIVE